MIEFGPLLPDLPALGNPGVVEAVNVMPLAKSYGPFPAPAPIGNALGGPCLGAAATLDNAGNAFVFAGDAAKLYSYSSTSNAWTDVSKPGGYATATAERWAFCTFGARLLAANYSDPVQTYVAGSGAVAFADLAATAPRARYCATVRDWLVLASTYDAVDGDQPQRVWWSAFNDPTSWPTPGTSAAQAAQSDFQDLKAGNAGRVTGIVGGLASADAVVFQERAVTRMRFVGAPATFAFDAVEGARGTPAPGSIVQLGALVFYLGEDGFYAFDGSASTPIGADKVDRTFFADVDPAQYGKIVSTVDPVNKLVMWAYCGTGHAGIPNRVMVYAWALGKWAVVEAGVQALARLLTTGFTLDGLDSLGLVLDALPFPLDSRAWAGGKVVLGGFGADNRMFQFSGANLAARVTSGEAALADGARAMVRGVRPITDAQAPVVTVLGRSRQADAPVARVAGSLRGDGMCPVRFNTRYGRVRVEIPAGAAWSHLQGIDVDAVPAEER